jgi:hypothetical protein
MQNTRSSRGRMLHRLQLMSSSFSLYRARSEEDSAEDSEGICTPTPLDRSI